MKELADKEEDVEAVPWVDADDPIEDWLPELLPNRDMGRVSGIYLSCSLLARCGKYAEAGRQGAEGLRGCGRAGFVQQQKNVKCGAGRGNGGRGRAFCWCVVVWVRVSKG